jgi:hypothetical protein
MRERILTTSTYSPRHGSDTRARPYGPYEGRHRPETIQARQAIPETPNE